MVEKPGQDERLLPLGSVVRATGGPPLVIVGRGLMLTVDGRTGYFDYGACVYPHGMIGDSMVYLNAEDITETIFEGFADEADAKHQEMIRSQVVANGITKGDTRDFQRRAQAQHERAVASHER